jgi:fermentation-respiration switch protein FrsA (DUF1100 family)
VDSISTVVDPVPGRSREPARVERVSALAAFGVIALHVVDDNYLQPEAGTSAGEHLVSGVVPLAALVLIMAVYSRLRPGARASIALVVGVLGLAIGLGEGGYYTVNGGPSRDDYTGLLTIPAGLALIVIGVVLLWHTRRRDGTRLRRYGRRVLLALGAFLVLYVVVLPLSLSYVFTHAARANVPEPQLGAEHENVSFTTSDGLRLSGWYVRSRNGAAVVVFPGRKGPQRQARMLVRHGYGALLFDRRGEGDSQGDPNIFGWEFDKDLEAAAAFLQRRPDVDPRRIGGLGLSVGGEALLQTAAESRAFKAVVSEGAGARSLREDLELSGAGKWLELPQSLVITAGTAIFSNALPPASLRDLTPRIAPTPVFFIYARHGQGGEELNPKYYAAAHEPKQLWQIPEGTHTGGIDAVPKEYERRVIGFFDRTLARRS